MAEKTITLEEAKQALDDMRKAFEEHKKVNDARIEAIKAQRSGAEFDEKLDRINETLVKTERIQREFARQQEAVASKAAADQAAWRHEQDEYTRKMEARINRMALGLGGMGNEGTDGEVLLKSKAFSSFLRKGADKLTADEVKVLTAANDTTGGYLSPPTYLAEVIKAVVLYSPLRGVVTVRTIGTGELQQPKRTGTAAATRPGAETATRGETTNPSWGLLKIPAPEMYAEARVTWANLEDSAFDLEGLLRDEFGEQFGVKEGAEVINGTGVGECQGILDAGTGLTTGYFTVSGSAATIKGASGAEGDGLVNLYHALKTAYANNARWLLNRNSLGKVRLLKDTTGQYLWQPGLQPGNPGMILGQPYTETPDMPDEGSNAFPIAFGDFRRAYTMVERVEMMIVRDNLTLAANGQVKFFARRRVGGQVVLSEAIRLLKCST